MQMDVPNTFLTLFQILNTSILCADFFFGALPSLARWGTGSIGWRCRRLPALEIAEGLSAPGGAGRQVKPPITGAGGVRGKRACDGLCEAACSDPCNGACAMPCSCPCRTTCSAACTFLCSRSCTRTCTDLCSGRAQQRARSAAPVCAKRLPPLTAKKRAW